MNVNVQQSRERRPSRDARRQGGQLRIGDDSRLTILARAWRTALKSLSEKVNRPTYEGYIRSIEPKSWADGVVTLAVPSAFAREWLRHRYAQEIEKCLANALANRVTVQFVVEEHSSDIEDENSSTTGATMLRLVAPETEREKPERKTTQHALAGADWLAPFHLNPRFTFEGFEAGSNNRMAREACISVVEAPGGRFNPLVLVGPSGVGKTHLLHAIASRSRSVSPELRIGYVDGESFTHRYMSGVVETRARTFHDYADVIDLWLVDDVQFVATQNVVRDEFYHILNELLRTERQVVLTSDRDPRDLSFEVRVRTRLEGGLLVHMGLPELDVRMAIVRRISREAGAEFPGEIAYFIANGIRSNVRALEGAVTRLVTYCRTMAAPLTIDVATEVLAPMLSEAPLRGWMPKGVAMEAILAAVSEQFGVPIDELRGTRLDDRAVRARQTAMYLCRQFTEQSYTRIGEALGSRDHTTVKRGSARIESLLKSDHALRAAVSQAIDRFSR